MVINPFKLDNNQEIYQKTKVTSENMNSSIDMQALQKYVINNYMEYLKKDLKDELKLKIQEYLFNSYNIKDEDILNRVANTLINKMFGYDILQKYIDDMNVTDIRAVCFDNIYIKKKGKWEKVNESFESKENFEEYIRYCILKNNSNINFDTPIVIVSDKKYNLRLEAGISPINVISPSLVIRIHRCNKDISLENLFIFDEMLDSKSYLTISNAIINSKNIIISGKGGSGKTSLLRGIVKKIPDEVSITTNEETVELYIHGKNIIQREINVNREESKKITLQKLMTHTLVMSNDVIIVGELKGDETSNFLDAICTGHMGLATVHSDSASNTIDRLITLFKRDPKNQLYTEEFITQILASSIDYVIYLENYKVKEIMKIDYDKENKKIKLEKEGDISGTY